MKSVILKAGLFLFVFSLFLSCQNKGIEVVSNKKETRPKYIKMDKEKNTLEECISELKRRVAMEPEFEKGVKFEEKKRYSVKLGSTKMIDAKIEILSDVSDEERKILTSKLAYNYIYDSIEWSYFWGDNIEKPKDFTFELRKNQKKSKKESENTMIISSFYDLMKGREYENIKIKITFNINEDVAQAFEVALDRGFKDIAYCIVEKADNKKDLSRMLVPFIYYFKRIGFYDSWNIYYSLREKKVDVDKPFPCVVGEVGSGVYNHFCYPLLQSLRSKHFPQFFVEDLINENSGKLKGSRDNNVLTLFNNIRYGNDYGYRLKRIKETEKLLAKNGINNLDLFLNLKDEKIPLNTWYTSKLITFEEESILKIRNAEYIFRFTYIPTFTKPVTIRIEKEKDKYVMISKRAYGKGGYDFGELEKTEKRELKKKEVDKILKMIEESNFWKLDFKLKRKMSMLDGSQFIFEGVKNGKYNAVERISIDSDDDSVKKIGIYLLEISGIRGIKKKTK